MIGIVGIVAGRHTNYYVNRQGASGTEDMDFLTVKTSTSPVSVWSVPPMIHTGCRLVWNWFVEGIVCCLRENAIDPNKIVASKLPPPADTWAAVRW